MALQPAESFISLGLRAVLDMLRFRPPPAAVSRHPSGTAIGPQAANVAGMCTGTSQGKPYHAMACVTVRDYRAHLAMS